MSSDPTGRRFRPSQGRLRNKLAELEGALFVLTCLRDHLATLIDAPPGTPEEERDRWHAWDQAQAEALREVRALAEHIRIPAELRPPAFGHTLAELVEMLPPSGEVFPCTLTRGDLARGRRLAAWDRVWLGWGRRRPFWEHEAGISRSEEGDWGWWVDDPSRVLGFQPEPETALWWALWTALKVGSP